MRGAYAVAAIAAAEPDKIVAVRKDAPLVAGIGKGFNFIASDIPALLKYVREVYLIENNETVVLTKDDIKIYNEDGKVVKRDVFHVTWDADAAEKRRSATAHQKRAMNILCSRRSTSSRRGSRKRW